MDNYDFIRDEHEYDAQEEYHVDIREMYNDYFCVSYTYPPHMEL